MYNESREYSNHKSSLTLSSKLQVHYNLSRTNTPLQKSSLMCYLSWLTKVWNDRRSSMLSLRTKSWRDPDRSYFHGQPLQINLRGFNYLKKRISKLWINYCYQQTVTWITEYTKRQATTGVKLTVLVHNQEAGDRQWWVEPGECRRA